MKTKSWAIATVFAVAAVSNATQFRVDWTNHGPQPLSPLFWSVGNTSFDIFKVGTAASAGIKAIAEGGNTTPMLALASAAGSNLQAYGVLTGGPLLPGLTRSAIIDVNSGDDYFQFAMMLGKTNDGFLGESVSSMGLRLFNGSVAQGFSIDLFGARAWDAGTELNTQNAADLGFLGGSGNPQESAGMDVVRVHSSVIPNVGDSWAQMPDWANDTHLSTLTVRPVPEPGSLAAISLGIAGLIVRRKTKSR
jgi:hypothetical protein